MCYTGIMKVNRCKIDNCQSNGQKGYKGKRYFPSGYCSKHYQRLYRIGSLEATREVKQQEDHGMAEHELYNVWTHIIQRCENKKNTSYKHYGAKGVKVCDRWRNSFLAFYQDMGERPKGYTIDRIDVYGNYEPSNCKWATPQEQSRNRSIIRTNTSGTTGVRLDKASGKWRAVIGVDYKLVHLGMFTNKDDAIAARSNAEVEYWGKQKPLQ